MSGITVGTRLEQLLKLKARLEQEITAELLRTGHRLTPPPDAAPEAPPRRRSPTVSEEERRIRAASPSSAVRAWAIAQGIAVGSVGRLPLDLHQQYLTHHHQENQ